MLRKLDRSGAHRNSGVGKTESLLAFGAAIGAAFLAREVLKSGWRKTLDRAPPQNPVSPEVEWKDALMWGATSGALVGLARIAARRLTSHAYRKW